MNIDDLKTIQKEQDLKIRQTKILFKKYKKWLKKYYEMANFEEPVLFILRNKGTECEFKENAKGAHSKGQIKLKHSDGTDRYYNLNTPIKFDYGRKEFKGFIIDEDNYNSLPDTPIIASEVAALSKEKDLNDMKKWKAEELKAQTGMWKTIIWSIIGGIAVMILINAMYPGSIPFLSGGASDIEIAEAVARGIESAKETVVKNVTMIINQT